jgi:hypothetical protein
MLSRTGAVILATIVVLATPGTARGATGQPTVRADLDGRPIKAAEISRYFCHDHSYPHVHCFSTSADLEVALGSSDGAIAAAYGPSDYVTIYSEPSYGGSYMHLSQNYDTLFWIGWSDQVSSYKGRNAGRGTFWSDWYGTGRATSFCCNQTVPYLSAAVDDTFTSVYRGS